MGIAGNDHRPMPSANERNFTTRLNVRPLAAAGGSFTDSAKSKPLINHFCDGGGFGPNIGWIPENLKLAAL